MDLRAQMDQVGQDIRQAVEQVISSGQFILGPNVSALEEEIAAYCGAKWGIGVANGTDALVISLRACGVGPGDEVITTPFTFYATAESISAIGATPVFVDIEPQSMNLNPAMIEERISGRTKAILPVHIFGQPADMKAIAELGRRRQVAVIEDACQSIGAEYQGNPAGSLADCATFSFFPTKNLSCLGDGGMVVTSDFELDKKVRLLRFHGSYDKVKYFEVGYNSRLDELQAAVLRVKLRYLDGWNQRRREAARRYDQLLGDLVEIPVEAPGCQHVYHLYVIRSGERDLIRDALGANGIASSVYYGIPMHLQPVYQSLGYAPGDLPEAERAAREGLAIPMHPHLTEPDCTSVAQVIRQALERVSA